MMNRREFLGRLADIAKLSAVGGLSSLILSQGGCARREPTNPSQIQLGTRQYKVEEGVLTQTAGGEETIKIGILADTHAHKLNTGRLATEMDTSGVNVFLFAGDLSHSFGDYRGSNNDSFEIRRVLESALSFPDKLVLAFPGNHEERTKYSEVLSHLQAQYPNLIDMERVPVADLAGVTILGLGGSDNARFLVPQGFLRTRNDFERFKELASKYQGEKPLLMATHVPKLYATNRGLDVTDRGYRNVGSSDLANLRKAIGSKFAVSGHIHEAFGIITPDTEEPLRQGELTDQLDFNPGAVYDHLEHKRRNKLRPAAGILEFVGNKARADILNI